MGDFKNIEELPESTESESDFQEDEVSEELITASNNGSSKHNGQSEQEGTLHENGDLNWRRWFVRLVPLPPCVLKLLYGSPESTMPKLSPVRPISPQDNDLDMPALEREDVSDQSYITDSGEEDLTDQSYISISSEEDLSDQSYISVSGEEDWSDQSYTTVSGEEDRSDQSYISVSSEED